MGGCFSYTVFSLYGLFYSIFQVKSYMDPKLCYVSVLVVWTFYYNCFVLFVLFAGSEVQREVN